MDMDCIAFRAQLGLMTRGRPHGTTADLDDRTLAYWNGHGVMGVRVCYDDDGAVLFEEFQFGEHECLRLHQTLVEWMAAPRYTIRVEIIESLGMQGLLNENEKEMKRNTRE